MQKTVLLNDAAVVAIPIHENKEPMIDLREQQLIQYGPSPEIDNNQCYTYLRSGLYELLCKAQERLPDGLRLCVYEGWRSLELQQKLFDDRFNVLKKDFSNWTYEKLFWETCRLVSPVILLDGSRNVFPHSTGGAVDIYLIDQDDNLIDMGLSVANWFDDIDGGLSVTDSVKISPLTLKNRQLMSQALTAVGLVNYPNEYWHWSYGDRYWAYITHNSTAFYGAVD